MPKTETFIEELQRKQQEGNLKPSQIKEKGQEFKPPLPPKTEEKPIIKKNNPNNNSNNSPQKDNKDFNYKPWLLLIGSAGLIIYLLNNET